MAVAVQTAVREVIDIRQASEYLGISGDTLYRYASEGFIPAFKLGNRWRFKKSLLDAWMDEKSGVKAAPTPIAVMPRYSDACRISITSRTTACTATAITGLRSSTSERARLKPIPAPSLYPLLPPLTTTISAINH